MITDMLQKLLPPKPLRIPHPTPPNRIHTSCPGVDECGILIIIFIYKTKTRITSFQELYFIKVTYAMKTIKGDI